jgi:hypothetical protein
MEASIQREGYPMIWTLGKIAPEKLTPVALYDLSKKHNLVPDSTHQALRCYQNLATNSMALKLKDGDEEVATIVISSLVERECAELDLIPKGSYFQRRYKKSLVTALGPLWLVLFNHMQLRRITSFVPRSRARTRRALKAVGFRVEGVIREGIKLARKDPEDLYVMGLLREEVILPEEDSDGVL